MCIIKDYIARNEGLRFNLYKCPAGKDTIGYGRNLTDNGVSKDEAALMLKNDLEASRKAVYAVMGFDTVLLLSPNRLMVLTDMMFNLGQAQFKTFKKMIAAVREEDYSRAAEEILNSKYAREDVPKRAERNAYLMREG